MAEKLYFGVPGNIQEIPYPASGMGFDSNVDTEVTELVSGGRSVYRAPTAYKTLSPNWRTNSANLAHLIDMYNGLWGPGPFYITDPTASQLNVLPSRWANAWQLAHQANGWCRPIIQTGWFQPVAPDHKEPMTDRRVKLTQATSGATVKLEGVLRTRLIRQPGKGYWIAANGTATGGAGIRVRGFNNTTKAWVLLTTYTTFTGAVSSLLSSADTTYTMLELDVYMPLGSTLILKGLALSTVAYATVDSPFMPRGSGIGAVQFDNTAGGELVSSIIDRIGLSLSLTEVQSVESVML